MASPCADTDGNVIAKLKNIASINKLPNHLKLMFLDFINSSNKIFGLINT